MARGLEDEKKSVSPNIEKTLLLYTNLRQCTIHLTVPKPYYVIHIAYLGV